MNCLPPNHSTCKIYFLFSCQHLPTNCTKNNKTPRGEIYKKLETWDRTFSSGSKSLLFKPDDNTTFATILFPPIFPTMHY